MRCVSPIKFEKMHSEDWSISYVANSLTHIPTTIFITTQTHLFFQSEKLLTVFS